MTACRPLRTGTRRVMLSYWIGYVKYVPTRVLPPSTVTCDGMTRCARRTIRAGRPRAYRRPPTAAPAAPAPRPAGLRGEDQVEIRRCRRTPATAGGRSHPRHCLCPLCPPQRGSVAGDWLADRWAGLRGRL